MWVLELEVRSFRLHRKVFTHLKVVRLEYRADGQRSVLGAGTSALLLDGETHSVRQENEKMRTCPGQTEQG